MFRCCFKKLLKICVVFFFGLTTNSDVVVVCKCSFTIIAFNYIINYPLEPWNRISQTKRNSFTLIKLSITLKSCVRSVFLLQSAKLTTTWPGGTPRPSPTALPKSNTNESKTKIFNTQTKVNCKRIPITTAQLNTVQFAKFKT